MQDNTAKKIEKFGKPAKRRGDIEVAVIHQPGDGPLIRSIMAEKKMSRFEAVCEFYTNRSVIGEHLVVGPEGEVCLLTHIDRVAHHCKTSGYRQYMDVDSFRKDPMVLWWVEAWGDLYQTPLDMPFWRPKGDNRRGVINERSLGICLVPPGKGNNPLSTKQLDTMWELVLASGLTQNDVFTHSEVHPYARTTPKGLPYDLSLDQTRQLRRSFTPGRREP